MTDNFIQLKEDNLLRIGIKDKKGNDTGEELVFDLEDVELLLKYQQVLESHKKNKTTLDHQIYMIEKKQDVKGKKLLTKNEEDKIKAIKEFYKKEIEALDLFLGKGKTELILKLMGRNPYMGMFDDIGDMLEPIMPLFEQNINITMEKIKNKYNMLEKAKDLNE